MFLEASITGKNGGGVVKLRLRRSFSGYNRVDDITGWITDTRAELQAQGLTVGEVVLQYVRYKPVKEKQSIDIVRAID